MKLDVLHESKNTYPGICRTCGETVPAGRGILERVGKKWAVRHRGLDCPAEQKLDKRLARTEHSKDRGREPS